MKLTKDGITVEFDNPRTIARYQALGFALVHPPASRVAAAALAAADPTPAPVDMPETADAPDVVVDVPASDPDPAPSVPTRGKKVKSDA